MSLIEYSTKSLFNVPSSLPLNIPNPFVLLDHIDEINTQELLASRHFKDNEAWQGIEAAAQACALHQRWLAKFQKQSFLLSINKVLFFPHSLNGIFRFNAKLQGQTNKAAIYTVQVAPISSDPFHCILPEQDNSPLNIELTTGLVPYDSTFHRELLEPRYRRIFSCLTHCSR